VKYIGLDFETSGTDPWGDAVPIQIGIASHSLDADYDSLIGGWDWNEITWSEESEKIHGITKDRLASADPVWKVDILAAARLIEYGDLRSRMFNVAVGWNVAGFDRQFVTRWMPNLNRLLSYRTVDLNALVFALVQSEREYADVKRASKEYAAEKISDGGDWHDAYFDAIAALYSFEYLRGLGFKGG